MSKATDDAARRTCAGCGEVFAKRVMTGIGLGSQSMWICPECVKGDVGDAVFADLGRVVKRKITREVDASSEGEGQA